MKWTRWALLLLLTAMTVLAALKWKEVELLRRQNDDLRRTCQSLQQYIEGLTTNRDAARSAELELSRKNTEELLRLRSEVTKLQAKASEAAKLRAENQQLRAEQAAGQSGNAGQSNNAASAGAKFPRESWKFSGYGTPEATLVSAIWAMREGNPQAYWDSLSPDEQTRQSKTWENKSDAEIAAQHQQSVANITGFEVLGSQNISDSEIQMSVFVDGPDKTEQVSLVKNGNDWKFAGFVPGPGK
jgi:hypothetical protein